MTDRQRVRVGRSVTYSPTDAEAAAGGDASGALWPATVTLVNPVTATVNLIVFRADGTTLAKTAVSLGSQKGSYSTRGLANVA